MGRFDDRQNRVDPNAQFLGQQSTGGFGNHAGPELALFRLVRWLLNRRKDKTGRSR